MYNDIAFVQLFIDNVLDLIKNKIIVSDELIKSIISDVTDNIKNIVIDSPWNFCEVNFNLFYDNSYNYTKLLSAINNIDLVMIKSFLKNIIKNSGTTIFIFGNIDKNNLPSFNKISNNINNLSYKFSDIKIKKNITIKHPNSNEISNCIKISYFIGQFNPLINLTMLFIVLMSSGSFFDNLRTDKQLGYLVQMNSSIIGSEYYIYQKIQSELSCDKIIKHINIFNKTLIKKIKEQDLNKWKITITNHLTEKAQNIGELFKENYSEILFKTYLFDRNKIMLKYIDEINIEIICDFINNKILNNKKINIINIVGSKYN
jgi:protease-3